MKPSFGSIGNYLLSCSAQYDAIQNPPTNVASTYEATEPNRVGEFTHLLRCKFNSEYSMLEYIDKEKQSMMLNGEIIDSICEFAVNKMLVSIVETDLLVIHDW